jgi:Ser/Thr protein kinase RdoA (MazF antagonist)
MHVDDVLSGRTGASGVRGALRSSPLRRRVRGVVVDALARPTPLVSCDRCARAEPALDLAKFLADLRGWMANRSSGVASAQEEFLRGYGPASRLRLAQAKVLEPLLLLKMTARRVPVHETDWDGRTAARVEWADELLRDVERASP